MGALKMSLAQVAGPRGSQPAAARKLPSSFHAASPKPGSWPGSWLGARRLTVSHAAAESPTQTPPTDDGSAALVDWVLGSGGSVNGVEVVNFGGRDGGSGFGLAASSAVGAGDTMIVLPAECHLTYDPAAADARLLALIDAVPAELWGAKLALALLAARAAGGGAHAPYIDALPVGVAGIPMFFSGEAIAAIEYPPVVAQVHKRCKWLYSFATGELAALHNGPTSADPFDGVAVDINALGWALAAVTSRAFRTRGPDAPASMLPLIDMCNHSFEPNAEVKPGAGGAIEMVAKTDIAEGDAIMLSYGPLSNDFLLMDYGFIVPGNPNDRVELSFSASLIEAGAAAVGVSISSNADGSLQVLPWQSQALTELGLYRNPKVDLGGPQNADARLLAAMRILCCDDQKLLRNKSLQELGRWDSLLSVQSEQLAMRTLVGVCGTALATFSTTAEADNSALAAGLDPSGTAMRGDMMFALSFRAEKKALLERVIQAATSRVKSLADGSSAAVASSKKGSKTKAKPAKAKGKGFGK